jgi:branched-subunit amino acid ABC-type transport system permease component
MAIALAAMAALYLLLKYTKFGKAQRAVADTRELALVSGVPVERVVNLTWLIVGLLAGLSGVIVATTSGSVTAAMGSTFLLPVFAAVILGGIGKPQGALVAAVIMGVVLELAAAYMDASYKQVLAVGVLFLALLFRPYGLFASSSRSMMDPVVDA